MFRWGVLGMCVSYLEGRYAENCFLCRRAVCARLVHCKTILYEIWMQIGGCTFYWRSWECSKRKALDVDKLASKDWYSSDTPSVIKYRSWGRLLHGRIVEISIFPVRCLDQSKPKKPGKGWGHHVPASMTILWVNVLFPCLFGLIESKWWHNARRLKSGLMPSINRGHPCMVMVWYGMVWTSIVFSVLNKICSKWCLVFRWLMAYYWYFGMLSISMSCVLLILIMIWNT